MTAGRKSRAEILYGTSEPVPVVRVAAAGPLRAEFIGGNLHAIHWHGHEVLRAISYLVRDENWGVYLLDLSGVEIDQDVDAFRITYSALCHAVGGSTLKIDASIEATSAGHLNFTVVATPDRDFRTNRCGFCVLHPIVGVAGKPVEIEHVDGTVQRSAFPALIDPAQPFFDMRSITHTVTAGVTATCRMEGDAFEMEDQRNWSDASYKTYVRPLALPWPYALPAGRPMRQRIMLDLSGEPSRPRNANRNDAIRIDLGAADGTVPAFGLAVTPEETAATIAAAPRLADIAPRHLILHFDPLQGHGLAALRGYAELLQHTDAQATLECVLSLRQSPEAELSEIAGIVDASELRLAAVAVSPAPDLKSTPPGSRWPDCPPLADIYAAARAAFPSLPLGGGMFTYFTELNRKRPPVAQLDFVTHTTSPLVHAADDRSVMQTLEALPFITRSVRAIIGDTPYRIGPSSIGMRHNPYGSALGANNGGHRMTMVADDPRQKGLFAASWMVGYAAATAGARLEALTLGNLVGLFGLMDGQILRPAYHAAKALSALSGKPARLATSSRPDAVLAIAGGSTVLVANLTDQPVTVDVPGLQDFALLDETTEGPASLGNPLPLLPARSPFRLDAYAVAFGILNGNS